MYYKFQPKSPKIYAISFTPYRYPFPCFTAMTTKILPLQQPRFDEVKTAEKRFECQIRIVVPHLRHFCSQNKMPCLGGLFTCLNSNLDPLRMSL
jgi:hypothetical protein